VTDAYFQRKEKKISIGKDDWECCHFKSTNGREKKLMGIVMYYQGVHETNQCHWSPEIPSL